MRRLKRFGAFWYDFVVGEDWRLALGVVLGLSASAFLVRMGHHAVWWLLPLVVALTLAVSLRWATRGRAGR